MSPEDTEPSVQPQPDEKDWTWTVTRACPDCGFDPATLVPRELGQRLREAVEVWPDVLRRPDARTRPAPAVWSPLEYAAHVRDVCRVMTGRLRLMLERDEPHFPNWDQDATAVAQRYAAQDPVVVGAQLGAAAEDAAQAFAAVGDDQWGRRGLRSNGSEFTVATLGAYFLHDLVHHRHDVGAH